MEQKKFKIVDNITIRPNNDFILVKVDSDDDLELTSGGIIVPHGALQNKKTCTGTVVATGEGRNVATANGIKTIPIKCEVGQRVIFATFIGYPIMLGDSGEHVIIKDYDVMGVIAEDSHWVDEVNAAEIIPDSERSVE